jgi:predicted metal-dependent HD superfamily phosphohydrolase
MEYISEDYLNKILTKHELEPLIEVVKFYYLEEHRYYHNWNHILNGFYLFAKYYENEIPVHIIIAWLFHDIVYIAGSNDSEKSSSVLLLTLMRNKFPFILKKYKNDINKSLIYIESTISHKNNTDDVELDIFLDVDMSYLGESWHHFSKCREQIRKEFIIFDDKLFNNGSIKFCKSLLKRDNVFISEYFINKYEVRCKENLNEYIKILKKEA